MKKRLVASIMLLIIALFLSWYGYQEYKKSQHVAESFIQNH